MVKNSAVVAPRSGKNAPAKHSSQGVLIAANAIVAPNFVADMPSEVADEKAASFHFMEIVDDFLKVNSTSRKLHEAHARTSAICSGQFGQLGPQVVGVLSMPQNVTGPAGVPGTHAPLQVPAQQLVYMAAPAQQRVVQTSQAAPAQRKMKVVAQPQLQPQPVQLARLVPVAVQNLVHVVSKPEIQPATRPQQIKFVTVQPIPVVQQEPNPVPPQPIFLLQQSAEPVPQQIPQQIMVYPQHAVVEDELMARPVDQEKVVLLQQRPMRTAFVQAIVDNLSTVIENNRDNDYVLAPEKVQPGEIVFNVDDLGFAAGTSCTETLAAIESEVIKANAKKTMLVGSMGTLNRLFHETSNFMAQSLSSAFTPGEQPKEGETHLNMFIRNLVNNRLVSTDENREFLRQAKDHAIRQQQALPMGVSPVFDETAGHPQHYPALQNFPAPVHFESSGSSASSNDTESSSLSSTSD